MLLARVQHLLWLVATVLVDDGAGYMLYLLLAGSALVLETHSVPPLSGLGHLCDSIRPSLSSETPLIARPTPIKDQTERRYLKESASTSAHSPSRVLGASRGPPLPVESGL